MKPSDVVISGLPPFIGMFGSCEAEVMTACMVKTLAVNGESKPRSTIAALFVASGAFVTEGACTQ